MTTIPVPASYALFEDAPRDPRSPGGISLVRIPTQDERIRAVFYRAPGGGTHPLLVLLHGFPGVEQNADLAHAARRAGWHVVVPHYRGAWGSPGSFTWQHVLEDTAATVEWARGASVVAGLGIDASTIAVAGHSLGGFAALMTAAADPAIVGAASFAGFNFGAHVASLARTPDGVTRTAEILEPDAAVLNGASGRALAEEAFAHRRTWDLRSHADALVADDPHRPLLLVAASADVVSPLPLHHAPLLVSLRASGARAVMATVLDADHSFADARLGLTGLTMQWLASITARRAA